MSLKIRALLLIANLSVIAASSNAFGQTVYEIEGTVFGPDGKAIGNVVMTLQNHAGAQVDQDITKSDGRYRFSGVVAGVYYISVKASTPGIQAQLQRIELINSGVNI